MLIRLISLAILLLLIDVNHIGLTDDKLILPKDKPSVFKKIEINKTSNKILIPQSKPIIKNNNIVEVEEKNKEKEITLKEEIKKVEIKKEVKVDGFIIPREKPKTVKKITKSVKKSKLLSQKDFDRAKITFDQIKSNAMAREGHTMANKRAAS